MWFRSPEGSSKQIVIEAEVHKEPSTYTEVEVHEPCRMLRSDNYPNQSDWDIIESEVASARNTPDR